MFPKLLLSTAALCGTLCLSLLPDATAPRPAPGPGLQPESAAMLRGPGGVIQAMQVFLQALDKGDAKLLDLLVADGSPRDGYVVVPDETTKMGFRELKKDDASRFFEVSHDGKPVNTKDKKSFLQQLRQHVTGAKVKARTLETRFRTIRADCPSQWCSYAVVEFERTYSIGGVKQKPVPMQASALVRYVKREDVNVPHFQIFHWHASRAAGETKKEATQPSKKG